MIIKHYITSLEEHKPWSGAEYNYQLIIKSGASEIFIEYIEELYPDGMTEIELNDILWFEDGLCYGFIDDKYLTPEEIEIKRDYWGE